MSFKETLKSITPKFLLNIKKQYTLDDIRKFEFDKSKNVRDDIEAKYGTGGDLLDLFASHKGSIVHKWHHYIPLYERYLTPYRGKTIRFLEIGVSKGGSLEMWRKYLGTAAIIYGIDINPACAKYNGQGGQVRIGSQDNAKFLQEVVTEMGGVDVVLDDGSHHMAHIDASLKCLFPIVSQGGLYIIEDLHSAYWQNFGGGYDKKNNFFATLIDLMHGMHHWYHRRSMKYPQISNECSGIHVHDSFVVLEKNPVYPPTHSENG